MLLDVCNCLCGAERAREVRERASKGEGKAKRKREKGRLQQQGKAKCAAAGLSNLVAESLSPRGLTCTFSVLVCLSPLRAELEVDRRSE